jgi:serine/threonine protein kinase
VSSLTKREGAGAPPVEPRFQPEAGTLVGGKYRVERVIGEGGMGVVALATHVELEQRVAIKFLHPEAMESPEVVERFLREAKVAARVKGTHIARVTDVGETGPGGTPFIVMEYLEGRDLGALIEGGKHLPVDEACEIILQAAEALAEVHAAGIVHRDLKPSNLFITRLADESPCVKLLDFGISKLTERSENGIDPALTATATIMGSPSYMSPEQLKSTKGVDGRADVWSLGAVLYEAVTGKRAFHAEMMVQVCALIASEEPAAPSSLLPDIPPELEAIILRCLDKKAESRATLTDLARVLVGFAPERAHASLERIEAILGAPPSLPSKKKTEPTPTPPLAAADPARTQSSWDHEKRKKRGGGGPLLLLALLAGGVFGVGVYTGRIDVHGLRGQVASATSAMGTVVASATSAVGTAVASATAAIESSIPPLPDLPVIPEPSASAADDDDDDDTPAGSTSSAAHGLPSPSGHPSSVHVTGTKKPTPHAGHGGKRHKHHPP